ncbi:hypothetical protein P167DRAFT_544995 [Morchella conica CCBAS932]|uniref:Uncharacterized protein n=1 Tax=Morchella conica CCBAS932 TaxID=1392247 RepID=A0A3N4KR60_9PEZI|nr:hypothetical protein P167DRAFT_544995 [Morchella conica CCBAS932]
MTESPISQMQPVSRVSTISRRLASKVLSMIEKYESLSHSNTRNQPLPHQQSANPASRSAFRRLGKSVLARARLFVENAAAQTTPNRSLGRTVPPRRRFLKFSSKKKKHRATKNGSNGFDHDGTISRNSTLTETGSSITASTPPVARILPSSFFKQLASSNESSTRRKLKSRGQRRKRGISPKIRDLRLDMARKESSFSEITRKLMPPKVSVRDLKERFQEAERAYTHKDLRLEELDGSSRVRLRGNMITNEPGKTTSKQFLRDKLMSGGIDGSFASFAQDQNSGYRDNDSDFFYEAFDKEFVPRNYIYLTSTYQAPCFAASFLRVCANIDGRGLRLSNCESTELMCRDDMNYLNTEYHCMADGSLSNFGYFLLRLESEAGTPDSRSEAESANENVFFTAPMPSTGLDSAQGTKKMYRKTPPPSGFFFHPENTKNETQKVSEENEVDSYAAHHSIAMDIVSPKPMNAVQAAQLRSMVFRYT